MILPFRATDFLKLRSVRRGIGNAADAPCRARALGRAVLALGMDSPLVFRTRGGLLHLPGRLDMLLASA